MYSRTNSKYKPPQGAYIRRSDLTEGFCVIILGGLYFGGAEQICTLEYSQETFSRDNFSYYSLTGEKQKEKKTRKNKPITFNAFRWSRRFYLVLSSVLINVMKRTRLNLNNWATLSDDLSTLYWTFSFDQWSSWEDVNPFVLWHGSLIRWEKANRKNSPTGNPQFVFLRWIYKPVLFVLAFPDYFNLILQSSSSSSVGCRAGDYELPPATTILCQFRQLARANHVVCVSQKVLNVSEKQGSLPSWFSLPMWWNIQCVLLAWLIIRHPEYMAQKPQLAGSDIFY